ncbi:quinoprotein dehydrogenase-associated putative ABC transporter substrate-binding protein [Chelativorans xinjiangense]|uniref:quinoprotein dehydrogenase-associated putative ABC transporter substrate-binding protein n=1 Tax=Chelativorans xinjiangense TaxID=2681485 RepID=UPI0013598213|nr:quinoprotein dehydrogenase-associated putative ABC transporter substrate-binding protein [Chelativorans xinjiangense]
MSAQFRWWWRNGLGALVFAAAAALPFAAQGQAITGEIVDRTRLRVCADPNNLPYSNDKSEGFENKIAELVGEELDVPIEYTWFPQTIGFVRRTLAANRCDLIIGVATTNELMQNTNPYYRSSYVMIHRPDLALKTARLDEPIFQTLKIGIQPRTPVATMAARQGLLEQAKTYKMIVDTRLEKPARAMVEDVAEGAIDVALTWGPLGGYWARQIDPSLVVRPLVAGRGIERTDYRISMGIRHGEPDWKHELNGILKKRGADIETILLDYGIPLLDGRGELIQPAKAEAAANVPEPEGYRTSDYRAAVPKGLKNAQTVDLAELQALAERDDVVLIDVMPAPREPEERPEGTIWREPKRDTIKDAVWLANMGYGRLSEGDKAAFETELIRLAGPDREKTLVFFCEPNCWMSWNAAKRAVSYGFKNVAWFPGGAQAWLDAGLEQETVTPWRP